MAIVPSSLQLSNPFTSPLAPSPHKLHAPHPPKSLFSFTTRATTDSDTDTTNPEPNEPSDPSPSPPESDQFESRLSQVRLRYRSGTGKKAELRKGRKPKKTSSGAGVFLPPVELKEPVSGGVKVDFGFSPYSERVNGRIAMLGLSALLLVELATGKSVISYHSPAIVFIQIYFVAAVSALYVKYEKEKISVWPESSPEK